MGRNSVRNILPRLLDFMATVPAEEHIHVLKLDLTDGYWRMIVTREERWNFAYVMPSKPGEELMVVDNKRKRTTISD
jgi:hypothetical protein